MKLEDTILNIQRGIKEGSYINEASVSQGIVLRLLAGCRSERLFCKNAPFLSIVGPMVRQIM